MQKGKILDIVQYNRFNRYFQIITFILLTILIALFFGCMEIIALENTPLKVPDFIPGGTIVLDEPSSQEIIYISSDQSIIVFRQSTPQLEQLEPGDVLLINAIEGSTSYLLFQIKHMIEKRPNNKGL